MLSVLREHEKPWVNPMLTEYREHATREVILGLFIRVTAIRQERDGRPVSVGIRGTPIAKAIDITWREDCDRSSLW